MRFSNDKLVVKTSKKSREGWEDIFETESQPHMIGISKEAENLDFIEISNGWDQEEWEW